MNAAANYAKANGLTTLEMTRAGQNLRYALGTSRSNVAKIISAYAKEATVPVHILQNASTGARLNSVWRTVEYLILKGKNNLNFHNAFKL